MALTYCKNCGKLSGAGAPCIYCGAEIPELVEEEPVQPKTPAKQPVYDQAQLEEQRKLRKKWRIWLVTLVVVGVLAFLFLENYPILSAVFVGLCLVDFIYGAAAIFPKYKRSYYDR